MAYPRRTERVPAWYGPFLGALAQGHVPTRAAEMAGITLRAVYYARAEDQAFAEAWEVAAESAVQIAEEELFQRAVRGTPKPIYWQGIKVDVVMEKSDQLLQFYLRSKRPGVYKDNSQIEVTGTLGHEISVLEGKQPIEVNAAARREAARLLLAGDSEEETQ